MVPPAVVEQQAKLGVSAEESKAKRIQRLQARFRDRGGAFVPSQSNPLVDILLARTVSGESPSKARPKGVAAKKKRLSPVKARQALPTHKAGAATVTEESQAVAGSSKSKLPASRKRKAKVVDPDADTVTKPAPKRRGRPAKGKKKAPDPDSDTEQPPSNTKPRPTSKRKGKQRDAAPSTSDGNPKSKPKTKAKSKSNPAREVVEVLVSDDDQTLVDVPHKVKSNPKKNTRYEDDAETDDDAPIVRKRAIPRVDDSKASGSKTTRVKVERIASSSKKTLDNGEERSQDGRYSKTNARKRLVLRDDDDDDDNDDVPAPPAKKGKVANLTSAKPKNDVGPEPAPAPRMTKDVRSGDPKATGKGKRKGRAEPDQDIVEPVEEDDDERPPERASKLNKRKKEEDNYDDRPQKVVKFSESGPPHSSSQKLKENQSDRKHKSATKSSVKDEPDDAPRLKLATKPPSRAKTPKGPPREVLERIKASAARHLRCPDSEPDELDCLS